MQADTVFVDQLKCEAVIGVFDWEKQITQPLFLDLEMSWDHRPAAASDDYRHALCYDTVSTAVTELVEGRPHELVETVAERVAELIRSRFGVHWVRVTVNKPGAVKNAANLGVRIERGSRTHP
ncbi:dihydroneopterin aldolase [Ferrimonas sediminicola]|uniref:7,8-dihydroneopterin aldolase n=1 Tax=Ferrimonas sediminicola TaxID=2569538 RepID=A0A4U1BIX3_9GAMM|nr:dihydroneopterin aldolase [Ferrimonas sediminicola]TKB51430.1 dihydroneopterin aldolase [Ferrimonas sediminicola]